ncbi:hydroxyisourate hydrolase [Oceanobacillus halophilus]|uniref:5-hydroxyisourate hydrolase n=1 Tax=Oceanobacillus halophilus TaxID=930130 RepID=A0A494ZZV8_9BACI|nr:hydroxyisourate hydrolase [Oceanobacillus halophilus]RKQ30769.1 hydroxyisourate hydrolase [Oceanobacillus halophilus]
MALTTQVLDLTHGKPAENVLVELYMRHEQSFQRELINANYTNTEGLLEAPLLTEKQMMKADYEILFYIGDYFRKKNLELEEPVFLDIIPIRFGINDETSHYHVPLHVSTWGYQIYQEKLS